MKPIPRGLVKVRKSELTQSARELIRDSLRVVPKSNSSFQAAPEPMLLWVEDEEWIGVPRGFYNAVIKKRFDPTISYHPSIGAHEMRSAQPITPRQGQGEAIEAAIAEMKSHSFGGAIVEAGTGVGKCLGPEVPVLLFNGSTKRADEVIAGDVLMGPDSLPRVVVSTTSGLEEMYKIVPIKGEPWTCNGSHILSMRSSYNRGDTKSGDIVNIELNDYFKLNKTARHRLKLWRTGVEFPFVKVDVDPYFVGLWLGDGTFTQTGISKPDVEIKEYISQYAQVLGMRYSDKSSSKSCATHSIVQIGNWRMKGKVKSDNKLNKMLDQCRVNKEKRIPKKYLINDSSIRKEVLAGLIDSDGYVDRGMVEITARDNGLSDDILFLARSLGLRATHRKKVSTIKSTGFSGVYNRIIITGDMSDIPVKIHRKKPAKRLQIKNVLNTGFSVEALGVGRYYGFEISGPNRLFLLGDFTVTHNTLIGLEVARRLGLKTLIVVHTSVLLEQWITKIKEFMPTWSIGKIRADVCDTGNNDICVGIIHSLAMKEDYNESLYDEFGLIIADEIHTTASIEFQKLYLKFRPKYFLGLSGTLKRADGCEKVFRAGVGPVISAMATTAALKPTIYFIDTKYTWNAGWGELDRQKGQFLKDVVDDPSRNQVIINNVCKAVEAGRHVMVLSERVGHVEELHRQLVELLVPKGIKVGMMVGASKKVQREHAQDAQVLCATVQLLAVGFDNPRLDTLVMATPIQGQLIQAVGRVLRLHPDKKNPLVIDLVDSGSRVGMIFGRSRKKKYQEKGWEVKAPKGLFDN